MSEPQQQQATSQLSAFAEDRYLHQTNIRRKHRSPRISFEDLPIALKQISDAKRLEGVWNIHFHVPIFLEQFGLLRSRKRRSSNASTCSIKLTTIYPHFTGHYEIETYAWGVLPEVLRVDDLCAGSHRKWIGSAHC